MWNNEKIEKLKELYHNTDNNAISEKLGINRGYIITKANSIGLKKDKDFITLIRKKNNPGVYWSNDDDLFLKNNYQTMSNLDLSKKLNKPKKSICKRLKKINLFRNKTEKDYITSKACKKNGRDLSFELINNEAKKYKTRHEFYIKDSGAYSRAQKNGWLDDVCAHMIIKNFSIPQLILKDILENILNEKCSYNDRKIIKPLEIDCYFNKWKLGFEYDGKYYHNDEKDNKKKDICNQKGITLFNITEKNADFRNYEKNIKKQIIELIPKIKDVTNIVVTKKIIEKYKPIIKYPNVLSNDEIKLVNNKKLSEIKKIDKDLFKKIKKYKICDDETLSIENDIKKNNKFKNIDEYITYLKTQKYVNFNEMSKKEHPYRLMKKWDLPIIKIKEIYEK